MALEKINIKEESGYKEKIYNFYHGFHSHEINIIMNLIKLNNVKKLFEFGTWAGFTAFQLARYAETVYTIDNHIYIPSVQKDNLIRIIADSAKFDFSPFTDYFDMVIVDGNHIYFYVKSDTENAFKIIKRGGIILWHDYVPKTGLEGYDVAKYLDTEIIPKYSVYLEVNSSLLFLKK